MLGFSPPEWFEIDEVLMACFTIHDAPGGQYVYRNRNKEWVEEYLSQLRHPGCYVSVRCGGGLDCIISRKDPRLTYGRDNCQPLSIQDLVSWKKGQPEYSQINGTYLTFTATDRRAFFLFYGADRAPENAWFSNPIIQALSYGGVPHKTRRQRKLERRDPELRKSWPTWRQSRRDGEGHPDQKEVRDHLKTMRYHYCPPVRVDREKTRKERKQEKKKAKAK